MPDRTVDFSADHILKLALWMHSANSIASRDGGHDLMETLGDLARDKPEAFDQLAPMIMKKAERALGPERRWEARL